MGCPGTARRSDGGRRLRELRRRRERRRYLDFSSQLVFTNLGHQHPRIVAAIKDQADRLCTLAPGLASDVRGEAARLIVDVAPANLGHVLFTTGGTEAIEHAVRMARLYTGRPKVLAAYRSYHGSTTTSIHLTGDPRRWASDTGAAAPSTSSARSCTARRSGRAPSRKSVSGRWLTLSR